MDITIERARAPTPEVRQLVAELDRVLAAAYTPDQRHGLRIEELLRPEIRFFIARCDGEPAGCGGVALLGDYAEVKRMYSRPAMRGRGVGKALLARLEAAAREAGIAVLRLETGTHQAAALALYERCGFRRCGPFGHYEGLPPHRIEMSLFYEKRL
jgi:putative acetyltransferase